MIIGLILVVQLGWSQSDSSYVGKWGVSIDPTSFLNYFGNFTGENPELPVWKGIGQNQLSIEYLRFSNETSFRRFQLGLSIQGSLTTNRVPQLTAVGDTINGFSVVEEYGFSSTQIGLKVSHEKFVGENRLKGVVGYFAGFDVRKASYSFLPQNSLENHIGDTILYDPGRLFQFRTGFLGGVSYNISKNLMISTTIDFGLSVQDQKESNVRQVVFNPIVSNEPYIENLTETIKTSGWFIDTNFHPNFTVTFLF